jgi:Na+/H+ antiporter NhaD/arsenite permease-like protein
MVRLLRHRQTKGPDSARQHLNRRATPRLHPYLLGLATASNIGSVATITGNPQNMLIGSVSHIGYMDFLLHLGPIALVGLGINWLVLRMMCAKDLARGEEQESAPLTVAVPRPLGADVARSEPPPDRSIWKPVLITGCVLIGFLFNFPPVQADGTCQRPIPTSCSLGRATQATPDHSRLRAIGMRAPAGNAGE